MEPAERNNKLLMALKHPVRRSVLREIGKHPEGVSPKEVALAVDETLSNCGYHCRVLRECGAITLVAQQQVRGAIKNVYRFTLEDDWAIAMLKLDDAPDLDP